MGNLEAIHQLIISWLVVEPVAQLGALSKKGEVFCIIRLGLGLGFHWTFLAALSRMQLVEEISIKTTLIGLLFSPTQGMVATKTSQTVTVNLGWRFSRYTAVAWPARLAHSMQ
jgi:hypothetical protein